MCKIGALITDLFEDLEYQQPAEEFRKAGHKIDNIGLHTGKTIKSLDAKTIRIDLGVDEVRPQNYDALFIPGGYSPDKLRGNETIINLVRDFMKVEKPVFAIAHGVQLLISARMLAGRRIAASRSLSQDIANAGGIITDKKVMVDSNLITCSSDDELPTFIIACLQYLSADNRSSSAGMN